MLMASGISWAVMSGARPMRRMTTSPRIQRRARRYLLAAIKGKKLGVIGLGAIGAEVANTATHLGMEVYGYDRIFPSMRPETVQECKHITNAAIIFRNVIIIHVPLMDSTRNDQQRKTGYHEGRGVVSSTSPGIPYWSMTMIWRKR